MRNRIEGEPVVSATQNPTEIRRQVDHALQTFLDTQRARLMGVSHELAPLADELHAFVQGGKRLRPTFAYWGLRAANCTISPEHIRAISALEWLHACALIHDDVMDSSDTRRGRPSSHRIFERRHNEANWRGDGAAFGRSSAILLGDLCLIWSDEALSNSGIAAENLTNARPVFDEMRTELMAGQYLDIVSDAVDGISAERAQTVLQYKSAKYTVEYPLLYGAALAGEPANSPVMKTLSAYGLPLGEAFQLRDDVLGVFGDPAQTGKPAGDDLREGKRTLLIAHTFDRANPAEVTFMRENLGDPHLDARRKEQLRELIIETGALDEVERQIEKLSDQALTALSALDGSLTGPLTALVNAATRRTH
ncbi:MAG: polyprenyl synthetase family protein [Corynebacteriales bacterium]|nr:polyprenyl synthetase family protein [Mycobacteriales bacterium]